MVSRRDPHLVLGLKPGASNASIKAAWRRLAREHHPDVSGSDPEAARAATKRMAEINAAYEQLRRGGIAAGAAVGATRRRTGGPPPPRPTRPVTARLDTTEILHPRNATTTPANGRRGHPLAGQPPIRARAGASEPPRASDPNGPLVRSRARQFRRPRPPLLEVAREVVMPFGKFHGHSLGEIAAFEPSYIDWMASTLTRDVDLVAAARVLRDDLNARGIVRRSRPTRPSALRPAPSPTA